jgi:hypothetical protein
MASEYDHLSDALVTALTTHLTTHTSQAERDKEWYFDTVLYKKKWSLGEETGA